MLLPSKRIRDYHKSPYSLDAEKLQEEVHSLTNRRQGYNSNSPIWLISSLGKDTGCKHGPMQSTRLLNQLPYLQKILCSFADDLETLIGRTRVFVVKANATRTLQADHDFYWKTHQSVYINIQSDDNVEFSLNRSLVTFHPGESLIIDGSKEIRVRNRSNFLAIYLVIDLLLNKNVLSLANDTSITHYLASTSDNANLIIPLETNFFRPVIHPEELLNLLQDVVGKIESIGEKDFKKLIQILEGFYEKWKTLWVNVGEDRSFINVYQQLILQFIEIITNLFTTVLLKEPKTPLLMVMKSWSENFIIEDLFKTDQHSAKTNIFINKKLHRDISNCFSKTVFIVSAPRSGSALLFDLLSQSENFFTLKGKGHGVIEKTIGFNRRLRSNVLTAEDASEKVKSSLLQNYMNSLYDHNRKRIYDSGQIANKYLIDKFPKHSLRIPFLLEIFPQAHFIYLKREIVDTVSCIYDGWLSGNYITYKGLPGMKTGQTWSFLLPPEWQDFFDKELIETAKYQYDITNDIIADSLHKHRPPFITLDLSEFLANRREILKEIFDFLQLPFDSSFQNALNHELPLAKHSYSEPSQNEWQKNAHELCKVIKNSQKLNHFLQKTTSVND